MTAGDALAYTELFDEVTQRLAPLRSPGVRQTVEAIKDCYNEVRHKAIQERVLRPRGLESLEYFHKIQSHLHPEIVFGIQGRIDRYDYGLQILVAGGGKTGAHIYRVFNPGTSHCFDAIGFHAICTGTSHAINALIAHECYPSRVVYEAIVIVYEAKRVAEKAPGVGVLTDMAVIAHGRLVLFPRKEIECIEPIYQKWLRRDGSWAEDMQKQYEGWATRKDNRDEEAI